MGALVAAHVALRNQDRWAGLILHSAAMGVVWTPLLRAQAAVGSFLAALAPRAQLVPAVKPEALHPDPKVVDAFKADALIFHGSLRTRTANEILKVRWGVMSWFCGAVGWDGLVGTVGMVV